MREGSRRLIVEGLHSPSLRWGSGGAPPSPPPTPRGRLVGAPADCDAGSHQTFSASMLRVHNYTASSAEYPAHTDLGLLTLAPRASAPGLMVELPSGEWLAVEESMGDDEGILFGGLTLAELTGLRALPHRVGGWQGIARVSAPYFLRSSPNVMMGAGLKAKAPIACPAVQPLRSTSTCACLALMARA